MLNKERKVFQVNGSGLTIGYKMLDKLFEKFQEGYRPPNDKEQQVPNRPEITTRKARFVLFKDGVGGDEVEEGDSLQQGAAVIELEVEGAEGTTAAEKAEDDVDCVAEGDEVVVEDVGVSMDNTKKEILAYAESKGIEVNPVDNKETLLKAINGA